jgi:hypothetical protein
MNAINEIELKLPQALFNMGFYASWLIVVTIGSSAYPSFSSGLTNNIEH